MLPGSVLRGTAETIDGFALMVLGPHPAAGHARIYSDGSLVVETRLPDAIFADLVEIIFTSLPPVAVIGVILTAVGILVAAKNNDPVVWAITALGLTVTVGGSY